VHGTELSVLRAWPTLFFSRFWSRHGAEAPGIIEHLYELRSRQQKNIASGVATGAKSAFGLYESDFDLFASPHPGLRRLVGFIGESIRTAVAQANGARVSPDRVQVEFTDSWFHITNDGGYHDAHFHGGCSWCGIYYLQSGQTGASDPTRPGNGVNRFYSPISSGAISADYGNEYLSANRIDITPQDGMLILFPAYLLHSALAYRGEQDRIIISFNSRSNLL
jgi:uncharacterized protein (TIGR02466 family)